MTVDATPAVCPLELILGLPMIRLPIDGLDTWLIVDTGANHTVLIPEAVARLGLPTVEADVIAVGLAGTVAEVRVAHVDSLRFDTLELGPRHLPVMPLGHVNEQLEEAGGPLADGVLGNDLLQPFRVTFDFPARRLELWPAQPARS